MLLLTHISRRTNISRSSALFFKRSHYGNSREKQKDKEEKLEHVRNVRNHYIEMQCRNEKLYKGNQYRINSYSEELKKIKDCQRKNKSKLTRSLNNVIAAIFSSRDSICDNSQKMYKINMLRHDVRKNALLAKLEKELKDEKKFKLEKFDLEEEKKKIEAEEKKLIHELN